MKRLLDAASTGNEIGTVGSDLMKATLCLAALMVWAVTATPQGYLVYHSVGPATFTNSAALGYADGRRAGADYRCGVYAGADPGSMMPVFLQQPGTLSSVFSASGYAFLSGTYTTLPAGSAYVQFRAWPAAYATFEEALLNQPDAPMGLSRYFGPLNTNVIIEFPIQTGTLWLQPIPEPAVGLLLLAGLMGWHRVRTRSSKP